MLARYQTIVKVVGTGVSDIHLIHLLVHEAKESQKMVSKNARDGALDP
jgi:hypothetical protein